MRQLKLYYSIMMLLILLMAAGCASIGRMVDGTEQERYLAEGVKSLQTGKTRQARELLERVIAAPASSGLTDEALFRLALLHLNDEAGKWPARSLALLERLKKEYPRSSWTYQSAPLTAYLSGVQASHIRDHEQNLLLQRENKALRQNIERLKNLDMEMDKKIKR
ncbi:MAG: tetratricopeptide repeat protein [Desulfuromonadaceae bacterium]|nr:tetratricopeptide repeat protein [Desulfuromonadaceae bacterium]